MKIRRGTRWTWEPDKPWACEDVVVSSVRWNGEEVWVGSSGRDGQVYWNPMSRWLEAAVPAGGN